MALLVRLNDSDSDAEIGDAEIGDAEIGDAEIGDIFQLGKNNHH